MQLKRGGYTYKHDLTAPYKKLHHPGVLIIIPKFG